MRAHDWRSGELQGAHIEVCHRCEAVAWNEPDYEAITAAGCLPGDTLKPAEMRVAAELVWTGLLPEHTLSLPTRQVGEHLLAKWREALEEYDRG